MQGKILSRVSLWGPPIVWAVVIFMFSSLKITPSSEIYWKDFIFKKSAHVFEYAVFSILLYRALLGSGVAKLKAIWLSILIGAVYGMSDEFHQGFTPGREPKLRDVLIDTFGATVGAYAGSKKLK